MKRHLFFTGEIQVGKSTLLGKVEKRIRELVPDLTLGGFRSKKIEAGIFIFGADDPMDFKEENMVAKRRDDARKGEFKRPFDFMPEVFEDLGVRFLSEPEKPDLYIMDELGVAEAEAVRFRNRVMEILGGNVPVMGVVKLKEHEFLDGVRAHENVELVWVDEENRDELVSKVMKWAESSFEGGTV